MSDIILAATEEEVACTLVLPATSFTLYFGFRTDYETQEYEYDRTPSYERDGPSGTYVTLLPTPVVGVQPVISKVITTLKELRIVLYPQEDEIVCDLNENTCRIVL